MMQLGYLCYHLDIIAFAVIGSKMVYPIQYMNNCVLPLKGSHLLAISNIIPRWQFVRREATFKDCHNTDREELAPEPKNGQGIVS